MNIVTLDDDADTIYICIYSFIYLLASTLNLYHTLLGSHKEARKSSTTKHWKCSGIHTKPMQRMPAWPGHSTALASCAKKHGGAFGAFDLEFSADASIERRCLLLRKQSKT